jgi:hypothetical protein
VGVDCPVRVFDAGDDGFGIIGKKGSYTTAEPVARIVLVVWMRVSTVSVYTSMDLSP